MTKYEVGRTKYRSDRAALTEPMTSSIARRLAPYYTRGDDYKISKNKKLKVNPIGWDRRRTETLPAFNIDAYITGMKANIHKKSLPDQRKAF
jgi:hypothetical protein